jgi:hypothetical protein
MRLRVGPVGVVVVTSALTLATFGCDGSSGSDSPDIAGDVDVDVEQGGLPDGFPTDDVPLPDATVSTGASVGTGAERSWTIVYAVDDVRRRAERYRAQLERAGFTIEGSFAADDQSGALASFTAANADYLVTVFAGGIRDENALTVTVAPS